MKGVNKDGEEIELKGEFIEGFERVEGITEIILLGKEGGVRRIVLEDETK